VREADGEKPTSAAFFLHAVFIFLAEQCLCFFLGDTGVYVYVYVCVCVNVWVQPIAFGFFSRASGWEEMPNNTFTNGTRPYVTFDLTPEIASDPDFLWFMVVMCDVSPDPVAPSEKPDILLGILIVGVIIAVGIFVIAALCFRRFGFNPPAKLAEKVVSDVSESFPDSTAVTKAGNGPHEGAHAGQTSLLPVSGGLAPPAYHPYHRAPPGLLQNAAGSVNHWKLCRRDDFVLIGKKGV
jgi:hypothetical protein